MFEVLPLLLHARLKLLSQILLRLLPYLLLQLHLEPLLLLLLPLPPPLMALLLLSCQSAV